MPLRCPLLTHRIWRSRNPVHAEFIDNQPVQERSCIQKLGVEFEIRVARSTVAVQADLTDELFPLAVPIIDHGLGKLDAGRDDQGGHVRQNILFEEFHIERAIGFDRRRIQSALDELGDRLHHQFVDADVALAVHSDLVLPFGHATHRFGKRVPLGSAVGGKEDDRLAFSTRRREGCSASLFPCTRRK